MDRAHTKAPFFKNPQGNTVYVFNKGEDELQAGFKNTGGEFAHQIGLEYMDTFDVFLEAVKNHVEKYGLIDIMMLDGHSTNEDFPKQGIGPLITITPERIAKLTPFLTEDCLIYMGGCEVGSPICQNYADRAMRTVIASPGYVTSREQWYSIDAYSAMGWNVFEPTASTSVPGLVNGQITPVPKGSKHAIQK